MGATGTWLGLRAMGDTHTKNVYTATEWEWREGASILSTNTYTPSDGTTIGNSGDACMIMSGSGSMKFEDKACTDTLSYACEYNPGKS